MSDPNPNTQEGLVPEITLDPMPGLPDDQPQTLDEIAARLDELTAGLAASWRLTTPDKLDEIAELMGQHEALLQLQAMPGDRLGAFARRVIGRTDSAKDQIGAQLVATLSEIDVYARHLAKPQ